MAKKQSTKKRIVRHRRRRLERSFNSTIADVFQAAFVDYNPDYADCTKEEWQRIYDDKCIDYIMRDLDQQLVKSRPEIGKSD